MKTRFTLGRAAFHCLAPVAVVSLAVVSLAAFAEEPPTSPATNPAATPAPGPADAIAPAAAADDALVPPGATSEPQLPPEIAARLAQSRGGGGPGAADEFPKWEEVAKDYQKVISTADGEASLYAVYTRAKDAQVLAELPREFESQKLFVAFTIAGGVATAGVQTGDLYAYWKRFDKQLALIQPNVGVRTSGDFESTRGRDRVFTDRVVLAVPIVCMGPNGGPVIDLDALLVGQSAQFFGYATMGANPSLAKVAKAKAFPRNVELAFELPLMGGQFGTISYSISALPENTGYQPRLADGRIGYFVTTHRDLGDAGADTPWVRYINRWNLEKADPKLRLSPPKQPIVFYLENTIPIRYRRWVRDAVLEWNKAFEKVGIANAIEVYQQDARTGAHMDKDPEDARYNFVLWTNAGMGFAIGPSRVDPRTGQIIDADIVMDEGFITSWVENWKKVIPQTAMENFGPETYAWLAEHPNWDPRVRLASPIEREGVKRQLALERAQRGIDRFGGHPALMADPTLMGDDPFDGLATGVAGGTGRISQTSGMCMNGMAKSLDIALFRTGPELLAELGQREFEKRALNDDSVSGTWTGSVLVPEMGEVNVTANLTRNQDNSVVGTIAAQTGSATVTGTYDPGTGALKLSGEVPQIGPIAFDLKVNGDKMSGSVNVGGQSFTIALQRAARPAESAYVPVARGGAQPAGAEAAPSDDQATAEGAEKPEPSAPEEPKVEASDNLDGVPEWFIGPLLKEVVMHEAGHVLGLRHNFKASSIYNLSEINTAEFKGKAQAGSVMDYNPININMGDGPVQGDYTMVTVGPYDYWAIEFGYSFEKDLKPIVSRVSEKDLPYATDEDTWGPDPLARRFDYGANSLDYADSTIRLVNELRTKLLERMVKDGQSWAKAREGYELLLAKQFSAVGVASGWLGGAHVNRDFKGDPGNRNPVTPVSVEQQRRALKFIIDNAFRDEAFGLSPDLLSKMTVDKWWEDFASIYEDPTWPVHDRIMGLQAAALTMIMNPTALNRVYDNEYRVPADQDAVTLPEVMFTVSDAIWAELEQPVTGSYSPRKPLISSLRRNLQREHLERLIDLSMPNAGFGASSKAIANLSVHKLRQLSEKIGTVSKNAGGPLDAYSQAHLAEAKVRIDKALDAQYIYNTDKMGGGSGMPMMFFGEPAGQKPAQP